MKNIALTLASLSLALAHAPQALAQTHCSSDGTPKPVALFERFISADCEACWGDAAPPAPSAKAGAVVLDWIVPSAAGDDAPLSAAATTDALPRLQAAHTAAVLQAGIDDVLRGLAPDAFESADDRAADRLAKARDAHTASTAGAAMSSRRALAASTAALSRCTLPRPKLKP